MYRHLLRNVSIRTVSRHPAIQSTWKRAGLVRGIQTNLDAKYAEKLQQRAKEAGLSVEELRTKAKDDAAKKKAEERKALEDTLPTKQAQSTAPSSSTSHKPSGQASPKERKDSSPVKPLSNILNVERVLSTPHTAEQIGALWTAYHAASSGGTGRGFVCAGVPLDLYKKMEGVSQQYPAFVVPLARPRLANAEPVKEGESDTAYEFYFMQWSFHEKPPVPKTDPNNPFDIPSSTSSTNPPLATVLFTPLQEYKSRQTFATPYLIATFYTDLATTHGTVLLRGEITPSAASANADAGPDRYLLSQEDAQMLVMMLQRFYLWNVEANGDVEASPSKVLQTFHEKPEDFKWENLVKASNLTA